MPLGSSYPAASALNDADSLIGIQAGTTKRFPGSIVRGAALPANVVDAGDYAATSALVLDDTTSLTNWTGEGLHSGTITVDTGNHPVGSASSINALFDMNLGMGAKLYRTFSSPQSITGRSLVAFDFWYAFSGSGMVPPPIQLVTARVADGTALTAGTINEVTLPTVPDQTWTTVVMPLAGLTGIKSIGLIMASPYAQSTPSTLRTNWNIANVRFIAETKLNAALASSPSTTVLVGPTYVDDPTQLPLDLPAGKSVVDFGAGVFSGLNKVVHLHDHFARVPGAETGDVDVAGALGQIINAAQPGQIIRATAGATYKVSSDLIFHNLRDVILDFTGATVFLSYSSNSAAYTISNCTNVRVKGGLWLGYLPWGYTGPALLTVAGSPTNSGTSKLLTAQNQEVKDPMHPQWDLGSHFSRMVPQQLGLPDDGLGPRNYFEVTLSDNNHVANDCLVTIYNDTTNAVLVQETLTLTATPTMHRYQVFNSDHNVRMRITVKKLTATANTITISQYLVVYGPSFYSATYDVASAWRIESSLDTFLEDMWIEGFGGDAVQVSDQFVKGLYVRRCTSRGCRRQGMSFNQGEDMHIIDCVVRETGRSGIDFEPFSSTWFTQRTVVRNCRMYNICNYGIAAAQWAKNFNMEFDNLKVYETRLGAFTGGAQGGSLNDIADLSTTAATGRHMTFQGIGLTISNIYASGAGGYIEASGTTNGYNGVTYTPAQNKLINIHGNLTVGSTGYTLYGAPLTDTNGSPTPAYTTPFGPVLLTTGTRFSGVHMGEWNRQFPNTYKGSTADDSVWIPAGFDHLDEPVFKVRALSAGAVKGNNLCRVAVAVAASAMTHAVTFPTRTVGTLSTPGLSSSLSAGSLASSTPYYYKIAARNRNTGGPGAFSAQATRTTGAGETSIAVTLNGFVNTGLNLAVQAFTLLRGTVNGGPYTTRFDVVPNGQFASLATLNLAMVDTGSALSFISAGTDAYGYASSYGAQAGSWTSAVDETGWEPDVNYGVVGIETNWNAGYVWITNKTTAGFTLNFANAAFADGTGRVSWLLARQ